MVTREAPGTFKIPEIHPVETNKNEDFEAYRPVEESRVEDEENYRRVGPHAAQQNEEDD